MTHSTLVVLPAVLAFAGLAACGGGADRAQAAIAPPTAKPADTSTATTAPPRVSGGGSVTGTVAETMNGGGYTYVRLQTGKEDVWVAASEFDAKNGDRLTAALDMPMQNFHSRTFNRDFAIIYFVSQISRDGKPVGTAAAAAAAGQRAAPAMSSHEPAAATPPSEQIAAPAGGLSIAEVWAKRAALAGKTVVIRGKVVKVNNGIMDRNWLHLQDGSGSAADKTNDLTVTTDADARVGDIVTASGVLAVKKDFGSGYAYDGILEKATLTSK
jgi:hypothetical protein